MSKQSKSATSKEMVATKNKNKVLSCSTPEHRVDSPSRDSDSLCDSEAASPVPFLCTQNGAEGETDVVWNFYTPNRKEHPESSHIKNTTPLSRKAKKILRPKIEKQLPKRRAVKSSQKKSELFQELFELNQNLPELMGKNTQKSLPEKQYSGSEEDIFNDSPEYSPKSTVRKSLRCLRKNVLSSQFGKPDMETLESDDSMNECLSKLSQLVEEKFLNNGPKTAKRICYDTNNKKDLKSDFHTKIDNDSMDAILNSIKLDSPAIIKSKKCDALGLNNDSFDSFLANLNDSALDKLTQGPDDDNKKKKLVKDDIVVHNDSSSSKSIFGRHSSMPESPSVLDTNKPSTSGMVFGRYKSMPYENNLEIGDSPIKCTPDEIKKKHQQAREKLLAKRVLPFTSSQKNCQNASQASVPFLPIKPTVPSLLTQPTMPSLSTIPALPSLPTNSSIPQKKSKFQPKVASSSSVVKKDSVPVNDFQHTKSSTVDIKLLIEKKRQEALLKLRRRQASSK